MIQVCVAGATGWTGSAVAQAIAAADDLALRSAVARSAAGRDLGDVVSGIPAGTPVFGSVAEALDGVDVLVDYTSHTAVKANVLAAVASGVCAVIGTSGLTADDYAEIDAAARARGAGVIAAGNFSLTAALALAAAALAAPHLPHWEIIDYASATKADAPSGTSRELAERLGAIRPSDLPVPLDEVGGVREARGGTIAGGQVHSLRLPSFTVSTEVIFAAPGERLSIRHDAGESAAPYVSGTLVAVRAVVGRKGVTRGLDRLLLDS